MDRSRMRLEDEMNLDPAGDMSRAQVEEMSSTCMRHRHGRVDLFGGEENDDVSEQKRVSYSHHARVETGEDLIDAIEQMWGV